MMMQGKVMGGGLVTDYDGNVYTPIIIGTQTWLLENLKTTHYNNGDAIILGDANWATTTNGMYKKISDTNYMYNQFAVFNASGICPIGYHIPTILEWNALSSFLGGDSISGKKLKAVGSFVSDGLTSDNSSGFTALANGIIQENGSGTNLGGNAFFFSQQRSYCQLKTNDIKFYPPILNQLISTHHYGFSVRCIKD